MMDYGFPWTFLVNLKLGAQPEQAKGFGCTHTLITANEPSNNPFRLEEYEDLVQNYLPTTTLFVLLDAQAEKMQQSPSS